MEEPILVCEDAPITLAVTDLFVYPLTPCCRASGKGGGRGVICRRCYHDVGAYFGDCWSAGEDRGWDTYRWMLMDFGADEARADALVAQARREVGATGLARTPLRQPKCVWDGAAGTMRVVFE